MVRLLLTTFLLSLYSAVASTSEYPKIGESWYPSSSLGSFAMRGGRDRRTTHWESRSHSNLDDDRRRVDGDKDRGHSQIPYPMVVEQSSSLGFSGPQVELSGRNDNEIDYADEEMVDNDSRFDHCITIIRKPVLLVPFAGTRRSPDDLSDDQLSPTNSGKFGTIRCRRRIHGWKLQEPVYVEEPSWVFIDLNRQMGSVKNSINEDDPFYVARGKRSLQLFDDVGRSGIKRNTDNLAPKENSSSKIQNKNLPTVSRRKKRNAFGNALRSSLMADPEFGFARFPGFGDDGPKSNAPGYVSRRNKHGDLMDILNEPFFISRGKKDSNELRRFEWYNKYAKKQNLDGNFLPISDSRGINFDNCDPNRRNCFVESIGEKNQVDSRFVNDPLTLRGRRGIMEDLLKEGDPFYVARGKRSFSTRAKKFFNDYSNRSLDSSNFRFLNDRPTLTSSSPFSTENINENLSIAN